jgi:hypothetical protein
MGRKFHMVSSTRLQDTSVKGNSIGIIHLPDLDRLAELKTNEKAGSTTHRSRIRTSRSRSSPSRPWRIRIITSTIVLVLVLLLMWNWVLLLLLLGTKEVGVQYSKSVSPPVVPVPSPVLPAYDSAYPRSSPLPTERSSFQGLQIIDVRRGIKQRLHVRRRVGQTETPL